MSRFPELFDEAIDSVVFEEALLVEVLAEHIASRIVERQDALRAEVTIRALWPIRRETPVTRLATQEMVTLIGIAAASPARTRRVVGVEATGINACPCAQGLVRGRASERLLEAGFGEDDVERILELVPIATHNQRGRGTLLVGTESPVDAVDLVDIVERSMSAPVYELLKRPDELFVVEHAHLRPRFVEDSVRIALQETLSAYPNLDDADFVFSRQVNLETIHDHDVLAERAGTVGELRAELETGARRARRPSSPNGCDSPDSAGDARARVARRRHGARLAVERHRAQRQPQHVRRRRCRTLARAAGRLVRAGAPARRQDSHTGQAIVWSGHREQAELYWTGLKESGLTMAPLEQ